MLIKERKLVAPTVYPETKAYWDAAGEGRLLVKQCDDCGEHHHYPRAACPFKKVQTVFACFIHPQRRRHRADVHDMVREVEDMV